jgi:hypothetical protein
MTGYEVFARRLDHGARVGGGPDRPAGPVRGGGALEQLLGRWVQLTQIELPKEAMY